MKRSFLFFTTIACCLLLVSCTKDKILDDPNDVDYSSDEYITRTSSTPAGRLPGLFSLSDSTQAYFSCGNLQFVPSTGLFSFAAEQYFCLGKSVGNAMFSETRSTMLEPIDLFGWGTSGYDNTASDNFAVNYQPWSYSFVPLSAAVNSNYYGYGPSLTTNYPSLIYRSSNYDWGLYNPIVNGGNKAGCWRVPTRNEWNYLFNERENAMLLYGLATVADVKGLVLLPDGELCTDGTFVSRSEGAKKYSSNTYTAEQWVELQSKGYVFLPAAGNYENAVIENVEKCGAYWSSSYSTESEAFYLWFLENDKAVDVPARARCIGRSVRLIQDIK